MSMFADFLSIEPFVFDVPPDGDQTPLKMAGKRYTHGPQSASVCGVSLLLFHANGNHKEQWEPTLAALFQSQKADKFLLHEAWALDSLTHGDSALLNGQALESGRGIALSDWSHAMASFVSSPHVKGSRLIAVGHSGGATALMLSVKSSPSNLKLYSGIILVDPPFVDRQTFRDNRGEAAALSKLTLARRDTWASKEEALVWFGKRSPWKSWDNRVVHLFVEFGLVQQDCGDVVLKCHPKYEAAGFAEFEATFEATEYLLDPSLESIPTYLLYSEVADVIPRYTSDTVAKSVENRMAISVIHVPEVRHMVIQEAPDKIAAVLAKVLAALSDPAPKL